MTKIRWPIDYERLIVDYHYEIEFEWFYDEHPKLNKRRAARAFCLSKDLLKYFYWRIEDFFVVKEKRVYSDPGRYLLK